MDFPDERFDYVVTVCDASDSGRCPFFPGKVERQHWEFDDPSGFTGTYEEKLQKTRIIRDKIKAKIEDWIKEIHTGGKLSDGEILGR